MVKVLSVNGKIPLVDGKAISATGGSSVPKPLTYDYMPAGYPSKGVQTITLMEEQAVEFALNGTLYMAQITNAPEIVKGQTYTVVWDGTEYICVSSLADAGPIIGNLSFAGIGDDTGEPFVYLYMPDEAAGQFATLDTSASHTISVKTTEETVTPMAEEFLPNIPADKLPTGANSTTVFYIQ